MDTFPSFATLSLLTASILTAFCVHQVLITPVLSKRDDPPRSLLAMRTTNLLFAATETVHVALCLAEASKASSRLTAWRFSAGAMGYLLLSVALLLSSLDRLSTLYRVHLTEAMPVWVRTLCTTLCGVFCLSVVVAWSVSMYSLSSFYWALQRIHFKLDVLVWCCLGIGSVGHIHWSFNAKIRCYLDAVLSRHNARRQIEDINAKLLSHSLPGIASQSARRAPIATKSDVLANNLTLAAKIREANAKLCRHIAALTAALCVFSVWTALEISRLSPIASSPPISSSPAHSVPQRLWMQALCALFVGSARSGTAASAGAALCVSLCCDCRAATQWLGHFLCRSAVDCLPRCCVPRRCLALHRRISDAAEYRNYFGRAPKNAAVTAAEVHFREDIGCDDGEDSLPTLRVPECSEPPPLPKRARRLSQVTVCGMVPIDDGGDRSDASDDRAVPQSVVDDDAAADDAQSVSRSASDQYDHLAQQMVRREIDRMVRGQRASPTPPTADGIAMAAAQRTHSDIGTATKTRRDSLILIAVDGLKQGIHRLAESKQRRRECLKEQQFLDGQRAKWRARDSGTDDDDDDDDDDCDGGRHRHQRSKHRLSAMRQSLRAIIPRRAGREYEALSLREHSVTSFAERERIALHRRGAPQAAGPQDLGTSTDGVTDDDNGSVATYGTVRDCLDDDLEADLLGLAAGTALDGSSLSSDGTMDLNPSVSADSISSNSSSSDPGSPPLRAIQLNDGRERGRRGSTTWTRPERVGPAGGRGLDAIEEDSSSSESGRNLKITVNIEDDVSCDDLQSPSESVL